MTITNEDIQIAEDLRKQLKLPGGYSYFITPNTDPEKRFYHVSLSGDRVAYDAIEMAKKIASLSTPIDELVLPHVGGTAALCYTIGNLGRKYFKRKLDSYPIITDAYGDDKNPGIVVVSDLTEISDIIKGDKRGFKDRLQKRRPNVGIGDDIFDRGVTDKAIRDKFYSTLNDMEDLRFWTLCIYQKDGASLFGAPTLVVTVLPNKIDFNGETYTCWVDFPWDNEKYEESLEKKGLNI